MAIDNKIQSVKLGHNNVASPRTDVNQQGSRLVLVVSIQDSKTAFWSNWSSGYLPHHTFIRRPDQKEQKEQKVLRVENNTSIQAQSTEEGTQVREPQLRQESTFFY
jgi:hypothetical protein